MPLSRGNGECRGPAMETTNHTRTVCLTRGKPVEREPGPRQDLLEFGSYSKDLLGMLGSWWNSHPQVLQVLAFHSHLPFSVCARLPQCTPHHRQSLGQGSYLVFCPLVPSIFLPWSFSYQVVSNPGAEFFLGSSA